MKNFRRLKVRDDETETWLETALAAFFMALTIGGMIAVLVMLDSAWATKPEPEKRCFNTAVHSERYCRTQLYWEAD